MTTLEYPATTADRATATTARGTSDSAGPARALQPYAPAAVPAAVTALVTDILTGALTLEGAVDATLALLADTGADRVAVTFTVLTPTDPDRWVRLGERAWLREWDRPGVPSTSAVGHAADGKTLSLPWFSQQTRRDGLAAIVDTSLLGGPASQDRAELERDDAAAFACGNLICDGVMYGSLGMVRTTPWRWPAEQLASLRMLGAALAARLATEHSRRDLADAIARGDQAASRQQQFFSTLGHELRTPIAAILGTAEMLAEEATEVETAAAAEFATGVVDDATTIVSAGEQLLAIVEALLRTGHELGTGVSVEPVEVHAACRDVLHWLHVPALTADVTVTLDAQPELCAVTTRSGLRQILTNLVGNAIVYNQRGGSVHVSATPTRDATGAARVRISVRDTGPGLTLEQQREVFTPFVRFAGPDVRGTGLGLALARTLAERDGGLLGVESSPGCGSVFWVDLPAVG